MRDTTQVIQRFTLVAGIIVFGGAIGLATASVVGAQDPQQPDSYNSNSGVPTEKPAKSAPTPADRAVTQKIRKAIAADKSISPEGRRVKITTQSGKVTLQGAAQSEAERTSIFTKAADVAGGTNVVNNITVSAKQ